MPIPLEGFEEYEDIAGTAKLLEFHPEHVGKLIRDGAIKAQKFHRVWIIHIDEIKRYKRAWMTNKGKPRRQRR